MIHKILDIVFLTSSMIAFVCTFGGISCLFFDWFRKLHNILLFVSMICLLIDLTCALILFGYIIYLIS